MNSRQNDEHTNAGGQESVLTEVLTNTNRLHIITNAYRPVFDSIEHTDLLQYSIPFWVIAELFLHSK